MSSSTLASSAVIVPIMPSPVRLYVEAANRFDLDGLVATFADEALVKDQQHEYGGRISPALALPPPLATYFAAKAKYETGAMLACFTPDAIVVDEAQEQRGHPAIRRWIEASARKHRVTVDVIGVEGRDGKVIVAGLVSGDFPGSPVGLRTLST